MTDWAQIRALPIDDVAQRLGLKLSRSSGSRCPFPGHPDKNASFYVNRRRNSCKCFSCDRGGSVIDLAAGILGTTPFDAAKWLSAEFDLDQSSGRKRRPTPHRFAPKLPEFGALEEPETAFHELYTEFLHAHPLANDGLAYLTSRCIRPPTAEHFRVGYIGDETLAMRRLNKLCSLAEAEAAGLVVCRFGEPRLVFGSRQLLFPFMEGNEVRYLQARAIAPQAQRRYTGLCGMPKRIFNVNAIGGRRELHICEGVMDVLSAHELGLAAIGRTGAHARLPQSLVRVLRLHEVYVVADRDEAGIAGAKKLIASLSGAGVQASVKKLTRGKDLNEFLCETRRG